MEEFTLCSDFAKRTSQFMSISDSDAPQKISIYEDADIADTLKVINSTRRFLDAAKQGLNPVN